MLLQYSNFCLDNIFRFFRNKVQNQRFIRLLYTGVIGTFLIPLVIVRQLMYQKRNTVEYFDEQFYGFHNMNQSDKKYSIKIIYSISISLVLMFCILILLAVTRNKNFKRINSYYFKQKFIIIIIVFLICLSLPNNFFKYYSHATRYVSIVFIIRQSLILVDLCYWLGNKVKKFNQGLHKCLIILFIITFQLISIYLNLTSFYKFCFINSDQLNELVLINIISSFILLNFLLLGLTDKNKQKGTLITSLISLYISYVIMSLQQNYPLQQNIQSSVLSKNIIIQIILFVITLFGFVIGGQVKFIKYHILNRLIDIQYQYVSLSVDLELNEEPDCPSNPIGDCQLENNQKNNHYEETINLNRELPINIIQPTKIKWNWIKWYIFMLFSSMYIPVLFTNWSSLNQNYLNLQQNYLLFLIKIIIPFIIGLFNVIYYFYSY